MMAASSVSRNIMKSAARLKYVMVARAVAGLGPPVARVDGLHYALRDVGPWITDPTGCGDTPSAVLKGSRPGYLAGSVRKWANSTI